MGHYVEVGEIYSLDEALELGKNLPDLMNVQDLWKKNPTKYSISIQCCNLIMHTSISGRVPSAYCCTCLCISAT